MQFTEWPDPAWAGWHALVLTSRAAPPDHLVLLRERGIPYLVVGEGHVNLPVAMSLLASELLVRTVVCTGGGRLGGEPRHCSTSRRLVPTSGLRLNLMSAEQLAEGLPRLRYSVVGHGPETRD